MVHRLFITVLGRECTELTLLLRKYYPTTNCITALPGMDQWKSWLLFSIGWQNPVDPLLLRSFPPLKSDCSHIIGKYEITSCQLARIWIIVLFRKTIFIRSKYIPLI